MPDVTAEYGITPGRATTKYCDALDHLQGMMYYVRRNARRLGDIHGGGRQVQDDMGASHPSEGVIARSVDKSTALSFLHSKDALQNVNLYKLQVLSPFCSYSSAVFAPQRSIVVVVVVPGQL